MVSIRQEGKRMILEFDSDSKLLTIQVKNETSVLRVQMSEAVHLGLSLSGSVVCFEILDPADVNWCLNEIFLQYQIDFSIADSLIKLVQRKKLFKDL